jgi:hypothetical protein
MDLVCGSTKDAQSWQKHGGGMNRQLLKFDDSG